MNDLRATLLALALGVALAACSPHPRSPNTAPPPLPAESANATNAPQPNADEPDADVACVEVECPAAGEGELCGERVGQCGGRISCVCAAGLVCGYGVCSSQPPPALDPRVGPCDPKNPCSSDRGVGSYCGSRDSGCGKMVRCDCAEGLECKSGLCGEP